MLPPGRWIASDQNAFEIALLADRNTVALQAVGYRNFKEDATKENLLIIAACAWGDLLFLTPVLRELRRTNPNSKLGLACFKTHHPLFDSSGIDIDLQPYPVDVTVVETYDAVISLENTLPKKTDTHATDLFAQELDVVVTDYRPSYAISVEESKLSEISYPKKDRPRVALQLMSSVPNRDYPIKQWLEVVRGIINRGWDVIVMGHPMQYPRMKNSAHLTNLTLEQTHFSPIRRSPEAV